MFGELDDCAGAQLSVLAAENAELTAKLTEREQAAQLEMQELRKFCIASQKRDSEKDNVAYQELQQQQQQMLGHLSSVESLANQAIAATQHISTRLEKVNPTCGQAASTYRLMLMEICIMAAKGTAAATHAVTLRDIQQH